MVGDHYAIVGMRCKGLLLFAVVISIIQLPVFIVIMIYMHVVVVSVRKLHFMAENSNLDEAALTQSQCKMIGTMSVILGAWIMCWGQPLCLLLVRTTGVVLSIERDITQYLECLLSLRFCHIPTLCSTQFSTLVLAVTSGKQESSWVNVSHVRDKIYLYQTCPIHL